MKYFAKIRYVGTDFCGFQVQNNGRTVQGELSAACLSLFGNPCKVTGCSRTASGVHANEFCVTIECDCATIPPAKLPLAIARFLPSDLSLYYAEECDQDFHPRYSVKYKEYLYRIKNARVSDPFLVNRAWLYTCEISDTALARMKAAAVHFVGYHDFAAFMSEGSDIKDTHRTVKYLDIERDGDMINVRIAADGFLYNMVRIIVGTLCDVAAGRISPDQIPEIIASCDRSRAGVTAPPEGLYLNRVFY